MLTLYPLVIILYIQWFVNSSSGGVLMKRLTGFIVNKRNIIFSAMLILTAVCAFLIPKVSVNSDMTKYLPDDSSMKQGISLMEKEFPTAGEAYTIRVMFKRLDSEKKTEFKDALAAIENVDSVSYDKDSSDYNSGEYTLYILNTKYGYDTVEEAGIEKQVKEKFSDYEVTVKNDDTSAPDIPLSVYLAAFGIILVVLLISCGSYFEPVLFLITIGIAVVLNLGTNFFLGEISDVSFGIAAVLQLALSMDYSIILMNRYRQELKKTDDRKEAMANALRAALGSITGSAVTTIVGLLVLVFMSFKIGADIGIVLAKGVAFSMLCVFTVLPALILLSHKPIEKTEKKKRTEKARKNGISAVLGGFSYRFRGVIAILFVVLFIATGYLQSGTKTVYTLSEKDPIADIFPKANTFVLLYDNTDEDNIADIVSTLEKKDGVKSVVSYPTTIGKQCTVKEMSAMLSETDGEIQADEKLLNLVYYHYHANGKAAPMTLSAFIGFLSDTAATDPMFSDHIDKASAEQLAALKPLTDKSTLTSPMPPAALAQSLGMNAEQVTQLLMLRYGMEYTPDKTMSLYEFVSFLTEKVIPNPQYAAAFDDATKAKTYQTKMITDAVVSDKEFTPEEMTELLGGISDKFDESAVELLYLYSASLKQENAHSTMSPEALVKHIEKLASEQPFSSLLTAEQKGGITKVREQLDDGVRQLKGEAHSRMTVTTELPIESEKTALFVRELSDLCNERLSGEHHLVGNSIMVDEMESGFGREQLIITLLTAVSIFIVVALTFRSLVIPAILVLIVQCGVFITVSALGVIGGSMYYLALLIVECILMGATIDYGILFTSYYRELRATLPVKEAIVAAYKGSLHTILTSGTIMVLITAVIGPLFGNPAIEQIVRTLSVGCASAMFLILFILPGILALCDKIVVRKGKKQEKASCSID